jgi:hypothetical protein
MVIQATFLAWTGLHLVQRKGEYTVYFILIPAGLLLNFVLHLKLFFSIVGPEPVYQKLSSNTYKLFEHDEKLHLSKGGILPKFQLAYETWGELNEARDNAILIFTGLSANSHAKSSKVFQFFYTQYLTKQCI